MRFRALFETHDLEEVPWIGNPDHGWWEDNEHQLLFHGTHERNLPSITREGIHPSVKGGWVSVTHDPHTAHGYASMSGGEATFMKSGRPEHVPSENRVVLVTRIPTEWIRSRMDRRLRGNTENVVDNLRDRSRYEANRQAGLPDWKHYELTELRVPHVPRQFITGYMRRR